MKMTFRWYGEGSDPIPLDYIHQIPGVSGIVGCLMDVPAGEVWPKEKIAALVGQAAEHGLGCEVIESVNIHDDIKAGLPSRDRYIENYKETIRNLSEFGIKVICYNFMPVFDWVKSDLDYRLPDGSSTLCFRKEDIPDDPDALLERYAHGTDGYVLPGWEPERLAHLKELFELYKDVDEQALRDNLVYFLKAIIPTCEECGVKMAIHPDDPPYSMFGLPRIIKNRDDLDWLCRAVDSPANGITLCCGSIAEEPANDVYAILDEFSRRGRIHFVHMRNIRYLEPGKSKDFYEAPHLSREGSLDVWRMCRALFVSPEAGILLLIYRLFQESFDGWMAVHEPQSSSPFSRGLISFASLSVSPLHLLCDLSRRGFLPRPSLQQDASRCLRQPLCASVPWQGAIPSALSSASDLCIRKEAWNAASSQAPASVLYTAVCIYSRRSTPLTRRSKSSAWSFASSRTLS